MKNPRVALVYDRVNKFGGAERVLLALHEIWPDAPLYTAVYNKTKATWSSAFAVHPSFLQRFPFAKNHHELYPWLTPMAFESFNFDSYDVVISVTSAEAKNIITKPRTMHICYCLTPTRYLWSGEDDYLANPNIGLPNILTSSGLRCFKPVLKRWDIMASARPDFYIAISKIVASRIETYYRRHVDQVIYPPVDTTKFSEMNQKYIRNKNDYFLVVSRLVPYKRIDLIIDAFNFLGWPLVVVGEGFEKKNLMKRAGNNIRFTGWLTDKDLASYYQGCRAFIIAAQEDFGISAVEAQAMGKPVISYRNSGVSEIIIEGKTGRLFDSQTAQSLIESLKLFTDEWYDSALCKTNAQRFSTGRFIKEMKDSVLGLYNIYI